MPEYEVGSGILSAMEKHGEIPAEDEHYLWPGLYSIASSKEGIYVYSFKANQVYRGQISVALPIEWIPAAVENETHWTGRRILGIVLHDTEGSYSGTISWFANPASGVSAHYVIGKAGQVFQMVLDANVAYHAKGSWGLLPDCLLALPDPVFCSRLNGYTIGVELELMPGDSSYTDAQYEVLGALLVRLTALHDIPRDRSHIMGHGELQSDRRDPRGLDWGRLGL